RVPPGIAKQVHAGTRDRLAIPIKSKLARCGERSGYQRNAEAVCVDVAIDIAGMDGVIATGSCHARRESKRIRAVLTERIPPDKDRKGRAGTGNKDSTGFPAAQDVLRNHSPKLWRGKLPKVVQ